MARYQNGLDISTNQGYVFCRWLVEWATQVLGWTLHDNNNAGWTSVAGSGADAETTTNPDELSFSGSAYTLTAADVGCYVTMLGNVGWSAAEKETIGIYKIIRVDATAEIAYLDIKRGVHESGLPLSKSGVSFRIWSPSTDYPANGTWAVLRTAYLHTPAEPNMDFHITSNTSYGAVVMGPFGTWNSTSHAWNDSRNTVSYNWGLGTLTRNIWAFGDETDNDHLIVAAKASDNKVNYLYLGAITPTAGTATDTNPGVIWAGYNDYVIYPTWGQSPAQGTFRSGCRWMAYNSGANDVSVTGYPMGPAVINTVNDHLYYVNRAWSQWSRSIYRIEPMLQCKTAGHFETRGVPKNIWLSGFYEAATPFGASLEYLHTKGGVSIPWNGSKVHVQWANFT
jgi:hypothetical protein